MSERNGNGRVNGAGGAPVGNRNARKHSLWPLKAALSVRGLDALDKRSTPYRDLMERREALVLELGGRDMVTKQQEIAVDAIARELVYLDHVDAWILAQDSPLTGRGKQKTLLPVFAERGRIVQRVTQLLTLIGLERKSRPIPSLSAYVAGRYGANGTAEPADTSGPHGEPDPDSPPAAPSEPPSENSSESST